MEKIKNDFQQIVNPILTKLFGKKEQYDENGKIKENFDGTVVWTILEVYLIFALVCLIPALILFIKYHNHDTRDYLKFGKMAGAILLSPFYLIATIPPNFNHSLTGLKEFGTIDISKTGVFSKENIFSKGLVDITGYEYPKSK